MRIKNFRLLIVIKYCWHLFVINMLLIFFIFWLYFSFVYEFFVKSTLFHWSCNHIIIWLFIINISFINIQCSVFKLFKLFAVMFAMLNKCILIYIVFKLQTILIIILFNSPWCVWNRSRLYTLWIINNFIYFLKRFSLLIISFLIFIKWRFRFINLYSSFVYFQNYLFV